MDFSSAANDSIDRDATDECITSIQEWIHYSERRMPPDEYTTTNHNTTALFQWARNNRTTAPQRPPAYRVISKLRRGTTRRAHHNMQTCQGTSKDKEPHANAPGRRKRIPTFPKDETLTTNAPRQHTNTLLDSKRPEECNTPHKDSHR